MRIRGRKGAIKTQQSTSDMESRNVNIELIHLAYKMTFSLKNWMSSPLTFYGIGIIFIFLYQHGKREGSSTSFNK